jgi:hypothetical protein
VLWFAALTPTPAIPAILPPSAPAQTMVRHTYERKREKIMVNAYSTEYLCNANVYSIVAGLSEMFVWTVSVNFR